MEYREIKTLLQQTENILSRNKYARDDDEILVNAVCREFGHSPVQKASSIERCRRKIQNDLGKYLPTKEKVARKRKMNIDEWRVAMGYATIQGTFTPPSEKVENTQRPLYT